MKGKKRKEGVKIVLAIFGIPFLTVFFAGLSGVTPAGAQKGWYNFTAMYIALALNLIFWGALLIYRFSGKKAWLALYVAMAVWLPSMIGVASLNLVYASFPDWWLILPLAAMYPIAALLPFLDERLSRFLFIESFAPRTRLGKNILYLALAIGPAAGVFGATLSKSARRMGNGVIGYSILGFAAHLLFVWGTLALVYQAWELRPWKKTGKEQ